MANVQEGEGKVYQTFGQRSIETKFQVDLRVLAVIPWLCAPSRVPEIDQTLRFSTVIAVA